MFLQKGRVMPKNITIPEFESVVTTRTLLDRLYLKGNPTYTDALESVRNAANDVLKNLALNDALVVMRRRQRLYVVVTSNKRIACELGVIADTDDKGVCKNVQVTALGYKGSSINEPGIAELLLSVSQKEEYDRHRKNRIVRDSHNG